MTELLYTLFPCLRPVPVPLDELDKRAVACEEGAAVRDMAGRIELKGRYPEDAKGYFRSADKLRRQARKYRLEIAGRSGEQ